MHNLIASLQMMTERMVEQINEVSEEQILFFIDQREAIVQQLQQTEICEQDIEAFGRTIKAILQHDTVILGKLDQLKQEASQGVQKVNLFKVQSTAYQPPYIQDSYYFDKKK